MKSLRAIAAFLSIQTVLGFGTFNTAVASTIDPFGLLPETGTGPFQLPPLGEGINVTERLKLGAATDAFNANDFARAETIARDITETNPELAEGWHMLGMALANQDALEEAVSALNRAGGLYKFNAEPYRMAGDMNVALGRMDAARTAYEAALTKDRENWRAAEALGMLLEQQGELDAARVAYSGALAHTPETEVGPRLRLAVVDIGLGNVEDGIQSLIDILKKRPDLQQVRVAVVRQLAAAGRIEDVADVLAAAADADPEDATTVLLAARAEIGAERTDVALERLTSARQTFANDGATLLAVGTLLGGLRDYEGAVAAFSAGRDLQPDDPAFLRGLRLAFYRAGDIENAHDPALAVSARPDATASDDLWLGFIEEARGDMNAAREAYRSAFAKDETNWVAANNLASLLIDSDAKTAVTFAERAVSASNNASQAQITLGLAYLADEQSEAARAVFAPLAAAPDATAQTVYRHGLALIASGSEEAGRAELARALSMDPEFEESESARALLSSN